MDFKQLAKIENESERVNRTYDIFNEDARLNHSKAARVEFLTTVHYIEKYLKDGDKILDIGASELLAARINEMSDEDYAQYLRYHFYICEKSELLGMTNHLLFVGKK